MFVGCSSNNVHESREYPQNWGVILVMRYELRSEEVDANLLKALLDDMDVMFHGAQNAFHQTWVRGTALQVELHFERYEDFTKFFGLNKELDKTIDFKLQEEMFFVHRTIKFDNPWNHVINNDKVVHLRERVSWHYAGQLSATVDRRDVFVFASATRRSSVEGSYRTDRNVGEYIYYFNSSVEQIVIYDKFANSPMWYVTGIGATIVFMGIVYLAYINKRGKM